MTAELRGKSIGNVPEGTQVNVYLGCSPGVRINNFVETPSEPYKVYYRSWRIWSANLMNDPIGAFDEVKANFIRYIKTAFGTRFESIEKEREELLMSSNVLCQDPWIKTTCPQYKSSGKKIKSSDGYDEISFEDLAGALTQEQTEEFKEFVTCGLFRKDLPLYSHQLEMLTKALQKGKHCVITAGTGSGKTESFLLPLFAYLIKESSDQSVWKKPAKKLEHQNDWWCEETENWRKEKLQSGSTCRVPQRKNEEETKETGRPSCCPCNGSIPDERFSRRPANEVKKSSGFRKCSELV